MLFFSRLTLHCCMPSIPEIPFSIRDEHAAHDMPVIS